MRQEQRLGWQVKNKLRATHTREREREEGRKPTLLLRPHKRQVGSRTGAASLHSADHRTRRQEAALNTLLYGHEP